MGEGLIESDSHLIVGNRFKVVQVDTSTRQFLLSVTWDEFAVQVGSDREFFTSKVEQWWHVFSGRHLGVGYSEVVEEGVAHRFDRGESGGRSVFEKFRDEVDRFGRSARSEHLDERMRLCTFTRKSQRL